MVMRKQCSISGCTREAEAKNLCKKHYEKQRIANKYPTAGYQLHGQLHTEVRDGKLLIIKTTGNNHQIICEIHCSMEDMFFNLSSVNTLCVLHNGKLNDNILQRRELNRLESHVRTLEKKLYYAKSSITKAMNKVGILINSQIN